jgi:hypothetical protein
MFSAENVIEARPPPSRQGEDLRPGAISWPVTRTFNSPEALLGRGAGWTWRRENSSRDGAPAAGKAAAGNWPGVIVACAGQTEAK